MFSFALIYNSDVLFRFYHISVKKFLGDTLNIYSIYSWDSLASHQIVSKKSCTGAYSLWLANCTDSHENIPHQPRHGDESNLLENHLRI